MKLVKKITNFFIGFFILFFFYNLFIKKDFIVPITENAILTTNLIYKGKEIEFKAEKMKEVGNKKEFENISIFLPDITINAKKAFTTNMELIEFSNGVEGKTNEGFIFKSEILNYDLKKENFIAKGDFQIENREKNINIQAQYCSSNKTFANAIFRDKVIINQEETKIRCNLAEYSQETELFLLTDNAEIESKVSVGKENQSILLKSDQIRYDRKEKKALSDEDFEIVYKDYIVKGKGFSYEEEGTKFLPLSSILITNEKEKANIKAEKAKYENSLILEKIDGIYNNAIVKCEKAHTENNNNLLILEENISLERENEKVLCDKLIYTNDKEIINFLSENLDKNVEIISKNFSLNSKSFNYNVKTKSLESNNLTNIKKDLIEAKGINFSYNFDEEKGSLEKLEGVREDFEVKASKAIFDFKNSSHLLLGEILIKNRDINLNSKEVEIDENKKVAFLKDDFKIILEKEEIEILSKNGYFDDNSKEFKTEEELTGNKKDYQFQSKGLLYNLADDKIYLKNSGHIFNDNNKVNVEFAEASFYNKENKGFLLGIKGKKDKINFEANKGEYLRENDILILTENVNITQEDIRINSNSLNYHISASDVDFKEETEIIKEDLLIIAQSGILNLDNKILNAKNIVAFREVGDIVEGEELFLDYNMNELVFNKNIKGELKNGVNFKALKGNIFFVEAPLEQYEHKITRVELKDKVEFKSRNIKLFCDFMEYDHNLKWVYGRDNLKINAVYPDGVTDIISKYAFIDVDKEIGRMRNEVIVTYKNEKMGNINTNSDEAILRYKERQVALKGHVKSYGSKSDLKVYGNEANLNLNTGIVTSKGSSGFTYSFDKREEKLDESLDDNEVKDQFIKEHEEDLEKAKQIKENLSNK